MASLDPTPRARGLCALGASAGGLDPLIEFLAAAPDDLGVAYLVVQHLAPNHESSMTPILEPRVSMRVVRMTDGLLIEPNTVYLLGPGEVARVDRERFAIGKREADGPLYVEHRPIDTMFSSLASWGAQAVAIVLSGTGSDGSEGIREVQAAGGVVLAQDDSASFPGMPAAADLTGVVDLVAGPDHLATVAAQYFRNGTRPENLDLRRDPIHRDLLVEVQNATGVNFDDYKSATVTRRLDHRIHAAGLDDAAELLERVRTSDDEADEIAQTILIGVTSFFRDEFVYDQLQREVLPSLVRRAAEESTPLRVWSVGCATGQEPYSLAMTIMETAEQLGVAPKIKIFATDVHDRSLRAAAAGWYSEAEMAGVNPERRERFFNHEADGWRIKHDVRAHVAFLHHNVLADPPFTGIDLVVCRNTLIYFKSNAQRDAYWALGFALREGGVLMLGPSEGVGPAAPDYESLGGCLHRLVGHKFSAGLRRRDRPSSVLTGRSYSTARGERPTGEVALERIESHEQILGAHGIGGLEVDSSRRMVRVYGRAASWLRIASGEPPDDAISLISDPALRAAAYRLLGELENEDVAHAIEVSAEIDGLPTIVVLNGERSTHRGVTSYIVHGRELEPTSPATDDDASTNADQHADEDLRRHLAATRLQLAEAVERQEMSEQALTTANEELLVSNEELQTSIEELSSSNEELRTLADENEARLRDVLRLTADLEQVLDATDIGIVLLDRDHTIRRFSGTCDRFFKILPGDVGRPLDHVRTNFADEALRIAVDLAADKGKTTQFAVEPTTAFPIALQVSVAPFDLLEDEQGVSIALIDVTTARRRERELAQLAQRFQEILAASRIALWERDARDNIWITDNFDEIGAIRPNRSDEPPPLERLHPDDVEETRAVILAIREAVAAGRVPPPTDLDMRVRNDDGRYRTINTELRVESTVDGLVTRAVVRDVSIERDQLRALQTLNQDLKDFTSLASHDLRAPLRGIRSLVEFFRADHGEAIPAEGNELLDRVDTRIAAMQELLDDLLSYARADSHRPGDRRPTSVQALVDGAATAARSDQSSISIDLQVDDVEVETDESLLATCLRNLIDNAVKHHPGPTGKVTVRVQATRDFLLATVTDDGAGIAPDQQEGIFRPFRKHGSDGAGIGLAAVHKIVIGRGGSIDVRSEVGQGTSFTITWPLVDQKRLDFESLSRRASEALSGSRSSNGRAQVVG